MRVVKLVLVKPVSEWNVGSFCLNETCKETEPFDFDVLSFGIQRSIRKAQSVSGVLRIEDLEDSALAVKAPLVKEIDKVEEPDPPEIKEPEIQEPEIPIVEEPKKPEEKQEVEPIEPSEVEMKVAGVIAKKSTRKIKSTVLKMSKTIENKMIILGVIKIEESHEKCRESLVTFLKDILLSIPEGE